MSMIAFFRLFSLINMMFVMATCQSMFSRDSFLCRRDTMSCSRYVGPGNCLDATGESYIYCDGDSYSLEDCLGKAEKTKKAVGITFFGRSCTILFDYSKSNVKCPEGFQAKERRYGYGPIASTDESTPMECYACTHDWVGDINCWNHVGSGDCLDAEGEKYRCCYGSLSSYTFEECAFQAEDAGGAVGFEFGGDDWQSCSLLYQFDGSLDCPDGFRAMTEYLGVGPIADSDGDYGTDCYACDVA